MNGSGFFIFRREVLILAAAGAGLAGATAATPSATALAMVRASSSVVNVLCAGRGDGGGDGDGGGGSGRCGGCGGIPPPPNMGFDWGAGDTAGGRFLLVGRAAPGVVVRRGWGSPMVPLGVAAGRRPGLMWLPGPGFAMAPALAVDFPKLVLEAGGFPGPGFERPGVVGLLLVVVPPLWLPAADVPGIPPAAVACPPVFGVLLPITYCRGYPATTH